MMRVEDAMNTYVMMGTLKDGVTLLLDQPLPITEGKVRVTVEAVEPESSKQTLQEYLADLRLR